MIQGPYVHQPPTVLGTLYARHGNKEHSAYPYTDNAVSNASVYVHVKRQNGERFDLSDFDCGIVVENGAGKKKQPEVAGQTGLTQQLVISMVSRKASYNALDVDLWVDYKSRRQPRTEIWSYREHRLNINGQLVKEARRHFCMEFVWVKFVSTPQLCLSIKTDQHATIIKENIMKVMDYLLFFMQFIVLHCYFVKHTYLVGWHTFRNNSIFIWPVCVYDHRLSIEWIVETQTWWPWWQRGRHLTISRKTNGIVGSGGSSTPTYQWN